MGMKILVVDDELMQRDMLKGFLEKQGFQVITAANGREAVQLFADLPLKIIGRSPAMTNLLSMVRRIAPSPWTVLIRGETGTGKELIARLIHLLSPGKEASFIEVNCAAIPDLIAYFLERFSFRPISFSQEAMTILIKYTYPGNIRELEHIVQRTVTLARGSVITPTDLPSEVRSPMNEGGSLEKGSNPWNTN